MSGDAGTVDSLKAIAEFHRSLKDSPDDLIRVGVAPSIAVTCSDALLEACADLATTSDLPVFTHLAESKIEAAASFARFGRTAAAQLERVGLLGPKTVLAHAVWVTADDLDLIAASGAVVAHVPASNLRLGSGIAPVASMLRRSINVAVGTDGVTCSDDQNLFEAIRLAALVSRVVSFGPEEWLSARDAFRIGVEGGAKAIGIAGLGRIAPGYRADLTIVDDSGFFAADTDEILTQLVFGSTGHRVDAVMVGGRFVLREGQLTNVDEHELGRAVRRAAGALRRQNREKWDTADRVAPDIHRAAAVASRAAPWPPGSEPRSSPAQAKR
jgi:cytosine/adenosine deaminase-related metal-dependent hydrolase